MTSSTAPGFAPASAVLARLVPGLVPLPAPLASAVEAGAMVIERGAGNVLLDGADPCSGVFLLERGVLRVHVTNESGRAMTLHRIRPGEACGFMLQCLHGLERYSARCEAETPVRGVWLPRELHEQLMVESAAFRNYVFAGLAKRQRATIALTCAMAFEPLDHRVAAALLERVETDHTPDFAITHQELADELSCTREAVSRVLERLAWTGAVELGRGHVHIRDRDALQRAALD